MSLLTFILKYITVFCKEKKKIYIYIYIILFGSVLFFLGKILEVL